MNYKFQVLVSLDFDLSIIQWADHDGFKFSFGINRGRGAIFLHQLSKGKIQENKTEAVLDPTIKIDRYFIYIAPLLALELKHQFKFFFKKNSDSAVAVNK